MAQDYFGEHMTAMDRGYYKQLDSFGTIYHPAALHEHDGGAKTSLGPRELGMSNNPFQNQLLALQSKIREGASSIEFQFPGRGKGNSQASTPETYGNEEREAMRQLAEFNNVKTSTHATFSVSGLAGFNMQQGFVKELQHQVMEEVKRAVDFAAQATTGGAVVVHTGEWQRPMSETEWARKDFSENFGDKPAFLGHAEEPLRAELPVVDARTGRIVGGIRKDQEIYEPKWITAKEYEEYTGKKLPYKDMKGHAIAQYDDEDYVDLDGKKINPEDPNELFRRMPSWDVENTRFQTHKLDWNELVKRTEKYNEQHKRDSDYRELTPEAMYAKIQIDNSILQARGSSLYHGQRYDGEKKARDKALRALKFVEELDESLPESEKWQLMRQEGIPYELQAFSDMIPSETKSVKELLKQKIDDLEKAMRYVHEASSSADVQAATLNAQRDNIRTLEDYGLAQSGKALGDLGIYALQKSKQMLENINKHGGDKSKYEKIYIAPENVFPAEYGSHPDELIKIVEAGREQMVKELMAKNLAKSEDEAKKLAKDHIKSTFDIGHLNMWKTHMVRKTGENEEQFNKRFENWAMEKLETMHKKGVLGHFHITDNLGFNDEHLTAGQGNAPIRKFVQRMEELGYKDFIIEPGSFNFGTALGETWSYLGMLPFPSHGQGNFGPRFNEVHWKHAAGYAPPNYIVGAYVPSNEWTLWSQVPLE